MRILFLSSLFLVTYVSMLNCNNRKCPYTIEYEDYSKDATNKINKGAIAPNGKKNIIDDRTGPTNPRASYAKNIVEQFIPPRRKFKYFIAVI